MNPNSADLLQEIITEIRRQWSGRTLKFSYFDKGKSCGIHNDARDRLVWVAVDCPTSRLIGLQLASGMSSLELFNLFLADQAKPKREAQCRELKIKFLWKKNVLIYLGAEQSRSVFVCYRPEGIEIKYQENAITESANLCVPDSNEDERGLITAGGDEFSGSEASERLWNSILRWFGTGVPNTEPKEGRDSGA